MSKTLFQEQQEQLRLAQEQCSHMKPAPSNQPAIGGQYLGNGGFIAMCLYCHKTRIFAPGEIEVLTIVSCESCGSDTGQFDNIIRRSQLFKDVVTYPVIKPPESIDVSTEELVCSVCDDLETLKPILDDITHHNGPLLDAALTNKTIGSVLMLSGCISQETIEQLFKKKQGEK